MIKIVIIIIIIITVTIKYLTFVAYTHILTELDNGNLPKWSHQRAPAIAIEYWNLKEDAVMRDVILAIRADEAHHRTVNHTFGEMKADDDNPFGPGK